MHFTLSIRRVGAITFIKLGVLRFSYCTARRTSALEQFTAGFVTTAFALLFGAALFYAMWIIS